jgi:hypothetical protein
MRLATDIASAIVVTAALTLLVPVLKVIVVVVSTGTWVWGRVKHGA